MSNNRPWNIAAPRPGKDGKTFWVNIGKAWPTDSGGFRLTFDVLPIPTMSDQYGMRVEATIFPPRDDDERPQQKRPAPQQSRALDDEIPF